MTDTNIPQDIIDDARSLALHFDGVGNFIITMDELVQFAALRDQRQPVPDKAEKRNFSNQQVYAISEYHRKVHLAIKDGIAKAIAEAEAIPFPMWTLREGATAPDCGSANED